jgi:hypothetical protein
MKAITPNAANFEKAEDGPNLLHHIIHVALMQSLISMLRAQQLPDATFLAVPSSLFCCVHHACSTVSQRGSAANCFLMNVAPHRCTDQSHATFTKRKTCVKLL